jgi:serine/threonine protein kinase
MILKSVKHPNIVDFYGTFVIKQDYGYDWYMICEHANAGSLGNEIHRHEPQMPEKLVREYASQIGHAVAELHKIGVSHKNLSQDTILMKYTGDKDRKKSLISNFMNAKLPDEHGDMEWTDRVYDVSCFYQIIMDMLHGVTGKTPLSDRGKDLVNHFKQMNPMSMTMDKLMECDFFDLKAGTKYYVRDGQKVSNFDKDDSSLLTGASSFSRIPLKFADNHVAPGARSHSPKPQTTHSYHATGRRRDNDTDRTHQSPADDKYYVRDGENVSEYDKSIPNPLLYGLSPFEQSLYPSGPDGFGSTTDFAALVPGRMKSDYGRHKSPAASRTPSPVRHASPATHKQAAAKPQSPAKHNWWKEAFDGSPGHPLPEAAPLITRKAGNEKADDHKQPHPSKVAAPHAKGRRRDHSPSHV